MVDNLPIYYAEIESDDDGIQSIALVDAPAVESNFVTFSAEHQSMRFSAIEDGEQRLLMGVIMRANFPIYRNSYGKEFFIVYKAEVVRLLAEKMLYDGRTSSVNIMHTNKVVNGLNLQELFIKDSAKGISPQGFEDIEEGSLFAVYKVHNDEIWAAVKDGQFKGFSLEGYFALTPEDELHALMREVGELEQLLNINKYD